MAKVSFKNLGLKVNQETKTIIFNGQDVEVKNYLPANDKLEFISRVVNAMANDDNNFNNPLKCHIYFVLEFLYAYTNINFTDKMKEDPAKLYDLVINSCLFTEVVASVPSNEYCLIQEMTNSTVEAYYKYRSSALGIMDSIGQDYNNLSLNAETLNSQFADPNTLGLVKDIITKLG